MRLLLFCLLTCLLSSSAPMLAIDWPDPQGTDDPIINGVAAAAADSHGDEEGFRERAEILLQKAAAQSMAPFRRGRWVSGGDPGTYTLPFSIAKLFVGEDTEFAKEVINDDRARRETYHFAALGWSRVIPLFDEHITAQTRDRFTAIPGNWLNGRGTDNHEVMWRTAAIVLSSYQGGEARGKEWLRHYVRTLIAAGPAEWDSPRYTPYILAGLLNIHDFSQDEEARAWARVGLDYLATSYALRRTGNIYAGPTSRGNAHSSAHSEMDTIGWMWWGGPGGGDPSGGSLRPGVHPATSQYRPPAVIGRLANREVPQLPFVVEQGLPNYWTGLDAPTREVQPNKGHATIWVSAKATLGTAWFAEDACSQMIHLSAAGVSADGQRAARIVGGWPGRRDGRRLLMEGHCSLFGRKDNQWNHPYVQKRYGQLAQVDNVAVCLAEFPADASDRWVYVTTSGEVRRQGDWYTFPLGAATAAVYPLGEADQTRVDGEALIRIRGDRAGFLLAIWDERAKSQAGVSNPLEQMTVDTASWPERQEVNFRTLNGREVSFAYRSGENFGAIRIDGEAPVHDTHIRSPFVVSRETEFMVSDGRNGFRVDLSGDRPRYESLTGMPDPDLLPPRQWTNREGRSVEAVYLSYDQRGVRLLLENGRETLLPLDSLSDEDQAWIRERSGFRLWTDTQGRHIEARPLKIEEGVLHIERIDGQSFQLPLPNLSETDQRFIKEHRTKIGP